MSRESPAVTTASQSPLLSRLIVPLLSAGALIGLGAGPALAAGSVAVSPTSDLPAGAQITVTGAGFDETIGIYVAVCVDNGPDVLPTPCIGGVDTSGGAGSSAWISSDPPSYAQGLTTPYGPGGSFEVVLSVVASDPKTGVDCRQVSCAVVTRADHTRTDDRSQDTRTRLSFAADGAVAEPVVSTPPAATPSATKVPSSAAPTTAPTPVAAPSAPTSTSARSTEEAVAASLASSSSAGGSGWAWAVGAAALVAVALVILRTRRQSTTKGNDT